MNQKHYQNMFHVVANVNLNVETVIQIKSRITVSFDVNLRIQ